MKVLINQSTGYLFGDVATALTETDEVVLLCSKSHDLSHVSSNVKVVGIKTYDKASTIKRLWTWIVATVQIWWIVSTRFRKAELLIVSNPPFANLLALILPNSHISHLIYDIYPDVLTNSGIIKQDSIINRIWSKLNQRIYRKANHIYTIGNGMAECLAKYVSPENIEIINCWPDITGLHEVSKEQNKFIENNKLGGKFIVLYSGNLGITHRVEALVDVAEKLKNNPNIHFVIIGEGGKKKLIKDKIKLLGLDNVTLLPFQNKDMLSHSLSSADIGIVTLDPEASKLSVPSKTFNLLYMGIPILVLGGKGSELEKLIDKYEFGQLFSPGDIESIAEFIQMMVKDKSKLKTYSENAKATSKVFSIDNARKFLC